jgi:glutathione synthase/RimK-type ligase-like ATP-grasp enzyme
VNRNETHFVVLGNPADRRVTLFQAALAGLGLPAAELIPYEAWLNGRLDLREVVRPDSVVRLESPGREFAVERQLLALGAEVADPEGYAQINRAAVEQLTFERGRLLYPRQWYLGFCQALGRVQQQLAGCPPHRLMNAPAEIAVMFDKRCTQQRLAQAGVPVPKGLGVVRSFDELITRMEEHGCRRVFIKLAHGSSAAGVVAYQTNGRQQQAITTTEMVEAGGELRLYNSRRMQNYRRPEEIARLINALCQHGVHVEQWIPKAALSERNFDLRVVMIGGRVAHVVVRLSRSPMTNLHLLNERATLDELLVRMPAADWEAAQRTCRAAMACFPHSFYAGLDLLIAPGFRRHAILEVNAFGDLLPEVYWQGEDTYTAEIKAFLNGEGAG